MVASMMGGHHAVSGAAVWIAISTKSSLPLGLLAEKFSFLPESVPIGFGLIDPGPLWVVLGAFLMAGWAMWPDADHHNATIAHALPPVTTWMARTIGAVSGGHRHGTHSIVGIAAFTALAWAAGMVRIPIPAFGTIQPLVGLLSIMTIAFAAKALKVIPDEWRKQPWIVGGVFGLIAMFFPASDPYLFAFIAALGCAVHIAGDMLTTEGCNLVWPLAIKPPKILHKIPVVKDIWHPNGYMALPILGSAGSVREWIMCIPLSLYAVAGVLASCVALGQLGLANLLRPFGVNL